MTESVERVSGASQSPESHIDNERTDLETFPYPSKRLTPATRGRSYGETSMPDDFRKRVAAEKDAERQRPAEERWEL